MGLTIADIDRWEPAVIRDVCGAVTRSMRVSEEVRDGLRSLPAFRAWSGSAAANAGNAVNGLRARIDSHLAASSVVAAATEKAVSDLAGVKAQLAGIRRDAAAAGCVIDETTATVQMAFGSRPASATDRADVLQHAMTALLASAEALDAELAGAVRIACEANFYGRVSDSLTPGNPVAFHRMWQRLTSAQKDRLYANDHSIGNHAGMPFSDRDRYNRTHLAELERAAREQLAVVADSHPEWLDAGHDSLMKRSPEYRKWRSKYDSARDHLDGLRQTSRVIDSHDGRPRYLGCIDRDGHAAVSINNPDTADNGVTFVPGAGADETDLPNYDRKMITIHDAAMTADDSPEAGDVSVTTWMGYDRPADVVDAASTDHAISGADALDVFQAGVRASHEGARSFNTVIGHSYGSTVVGAAASGGRHLDADRVVAIGSPGMLVDKASELNINRPGQIYASRAQHNPIMYAEGSTLGPGPSHTLDYGAHSFDSDPGDVGGPSWLHWLGLPSAQAHSSYFDDDSAGVLNMGQLAVGQQPTHRSGGAR